MSFANLFRRHSNSSEVQAAHYVCNDDSSTAETLLDELEMQCRNSSTLMSLRTKRNSEVVVHGTGLLASAYNSPSKRRSSVDYSWLTPQNNLLQTPSELYHLSDIIKMELNELIRFVLPEDCTAVVNTFRRHIRSLISPTTPETIIALFRKTVSNHIDHRRKHRSNSSEIVRPNEGNQVPCKTINLCVRNNRILPRHQSEEEQHSIAELAQISLTSRSNETTDVKPRSNTYV